MCEAALSWFIGTHFLRADINQFSKAAEQGDPWDGYIARLYIISDFPSIFCLQRDHALVP